MQILEKEVKKNANFGERLREKCKFWRKIERKMQISEKDCPCG